jgi:hypothetical protein
MDPVSDLEIVPETILDPFLVKDLDPVPVLETVPDPYPDTYTNPD